MSDGITSAGRRLATPDPITPEGLRRAATVVALVAAGVVAILTVL